MKPLRLFFLGLLFVSIGCTKSETSLARAEVVPEVVALETQLLPVPKSIQRRPGSFVLRKDLSLCLVRRDSKSSAPAYIDFLLRELNSRFGISARFQSVVGKVSSSSVLHLVSQDTQSCDQVPNTIDDVPDNPEGYILSSSDRAVSIASLSDRGIFYGIQTLLQLIQGTGPNPAVLGVTITDYPDWSFRAVHLILRNGPMARFGTDIDLFDRVLRLCAELKFNTIIVQIDDALRYDSHPELNGDVSKTRFRKSLDLARSLYLDLIPQLEAFGHQKYFLFQGGSTHLDLAQADSFEDYCPCNEKVYRIFFDLWDEVIDLMQPRYAHIGHDEITSFTKCDSCSGKLTPDVLAESIGQFHTYFQKKRIRTMIWGDMFLAKEAFPKSSYVHGNTDGSGAYKALSKLPRDIVVLDWHYKEHKPEQTFPTALHFKNEGFPVMGVTWASPVNNRRFSEFLHSIGGDGMVVSTWAAFNKAEAQGKDFMSKTKFGKAIVAAAEPFWNVESKAELDVKSHEAVLRNSLRAGRLTTEPIR